MDGKVLGKGLSALIQSQAANVNSSEVTNLKLSLIKNNQVQPRTHYDDEKLGELKASIKEKGVLQPILVRPQGGGYEVVAGERRLRAARELQLTEIPVIVKDLSDQEALVIALVENIQREDLNPIEEAEAYQKLIEEFGFTQEKIAQSVGKDRSTVTNLLRLLRLSDDMRKAVYDGKISMGHARALLSVQDSILRREYYKETIAKQLSVRELENLVKRQLNTGGARRVKKPVDVDYEILAVEEELQKTLGTKVRIQSQKKRGKIVIEYYSASDLDRLIAFIKK